MVPGSLTLDYFRLVNERCMLYAPLSYTRFTHDTRYTHNVNVRYTFLCSMRLIPYNVNDPRRYNVISTTVFGDVQRK